VHDLNFPFMNQQNGSNDRQIFFSYVQVFVWMEIPGLKFATINFCTRLLYSWILSLKIHWGNDVWEMVSMTVDLGKNRIWSGFGTWVWSRVKANIINEPLLTLAKPGASLWWTLASKNQSNSTSVYFVLRRTCCLKYMLLVGTVSVHQRKY